MLILGFLVLLILGGLAAAFLVVRVLQILSLLVMVIAVAAGLGALAFAAIVGLIAGLVLQATITAAFPLLSIAAGLTVAVLVARATLRRMVSEVRTARQRLGLKPKTKSNPLPELPHQSS